MRTSEIRADLWILHHCLLSHQEEQWLLQVPPHPAASGKKVGLETAWEDHGGGDSKVQSTVRKGNPNFNVTPQRKLPCGVCLFKNPGKEGP